MGKLRCFGCFGVSVILVLLIAGCGGSGGSNLNQGTIEIVSGEALNPQTDALARRRRIAGTTLRIRVDGDDRPSHSVPLAELIESFPALPGTHLVEFELDNKRGQVIAQGRQQASVLISMVTLAELVFDPPNCEAVQDITCRTPALVVPATVAAEADTEQCVMINDAMSPLDGLQICIPPGVLEADTTVEVTEVYNILSSMPDHLSQAGVIVDIRFDPEPFLSQPITLRFPYDEGLVATGEQNLGINETDLDLFQLNSRAGQWVPLPGQPPPDTNTNTVTAQSHSLGFFVVGGPLPDAGIPPVANHQIVHTFVNTSVPITLTGSDADGNPLLFRVVSPPNRGDFSLTTGLAVEDDVIGGVLVVPESMVLAYTPELNFFGRDTFLFEAEEVSAAGLRSILAIVTIEVHPRQSFMECIISALGPGDQCLDISPEGAAMGASPLDLVVADVNGDLLLDLITANSESGDISILLGQDGRSFSAPYKFPVSGRPVAVVIEDFNDDMIPDLATANRESNDISIFIGQPNEALHLNFVVQSGFFAGASPSDLAVGDINGDAVPDLVTANADAENVFIRFGRRDATPFTLADQSVLDMGARLNAVALADLNNDSCLDILTATNDNTVTIQLTEPDGDRCSLPTPLDLLIVEVGVPPPP